MLRTWICTTCKVVYNCPSLYVQKANAGKCGTGYEKRILSADMLDGEKKNFIIPIIRNNTNKKVPNFLKGLLYIDFSSDDQYLSQYRQLLERIYDEDVKAKPELGKNPFDTKDLSITIDKKLELEKIQFFNASLEGKVRFDYSANDGIFTIGTGEYAFRTMWTKAGCSSIHCYKDCVKRLGYNAEFTKFPTFQEIPLFDFSSRSREVKIGQVVVLENDRNNYAAIRILDIEPSGNDQNNFVEFEYKIYCALCIQ